MNSLCEQKTRECQINTLYAAVYDMMNAVNTDLLPAVLLQTVEQLIDVREPERQQLKVFLVTLKKKIVLIHFLIL